MEVALFSSAAGAILPSLNNAVPAVAVASAKVLPMGMRRRVHTQSTSSQRLSAAALRNVTRCSAIAQPPNSASFQRGSAAMPALKPIPDPTADHTPAPSLQEIDVPAYVEANIKPYHGDTSFLAPPTERTLAVCKKIEELLIEEQKRGVLDVDPSVPSSITAFGPGYIDKDNEVIVGVQCDAPFKRAIKPLGGVGMVRAALEAFNFPVDEETLKVYTTVRKTHNQGVFDAYTAEMRAARKSGILTGLPDGYGRGRIIGDYRRVPLYGVDKLVAAKKDDLNRHLIGVMTEERIRLREEVQEQIRALNELKEMAASYGYDIGRPAENAREAVQGLYFAYLGAVKEQDGAAMSFGRVDGFLDTFFERDLEAGRITETEAQEMIDQLVLKLRIVKQLRTPDFNELFTGDPTWVTAALGGVDAIGRSAVTKTTFRFLRTLQNLGPAPEPNMTVLWHPALPESFKKYCAQVSIETSSIQYENDVVMGPLFGSDYGIACCVSAMRIGKDMQYFGARCNLPKLLLYILNEGRDEISGKQVGPKFAPVPEGPLDFEDTLHRVEKGMDWLMHLYSNTMNIIHFMHDKYNYERLQMALHDTDIRRFMAFGVSGLSVLADSLSAIKYAKVTPIRNEDGLAVDFKIEGDFPKYGNDDQRVDGIAQWILRTSSHKLGSQQSYRNSIPTLSALTITSNVVYGLKTGNTPDGRKKGEPFAPGANPMHGRETSGALASLNSVAKMPYDECLDGISNTFTLVPSVLGKDNVKRLDTLSGLLDGYFEKGGHHLNVNVLNRQTLMDAVDHPEKYPNLTIRVSGYAVHFNKLTPAQQQEVISRTFHESM